MLLIDHLRLNRKIPGVNDPLWKNENPENANVVLLAVNRPRPLATNLPVLGRDSS